ncbi:MAG: hypothetical protein H6Q68_2455 [Firmicutes bacterium]|nr:hypothetical protein [Bacillota bacterium]
MLATRRCKKTGNAYEATNIVAFLLCMGLKGLS